MAAPPSPPHGQPSVCSLPEVFPPPAAPLPEIFPPPAATLPEILPPPDSPLPEILPPPAATLPEILPPPDSPLPEILPPPVAPLPEVLPPPVDPLPEDLPPEYPELTVNSLPAPHPSTEILREYVGYLIRIDNLAAAIQAHPKNYQLLHRLHAEYEDRSRLAQRIMVHPTVTVTNYSEFNVLCEDAEIARDTKVWVHEDTSPRSVACIHRRQDDTGRTYRVLFASELSAEEMAGDRDELFNSKNPDYSSESGSIVDVSSGSSHGYGYSDDSVED